LKREGKEGKKEERKEEEVRMADSINETSFLCSEFREFCQNGKSEVYHCH